MKDYKEMTKSILEKSVESKNKYQRKIIKSIIIGFACMLAVDCAFIAIWLYALNKRNVDSNDNVEVQKHLLLKNGNYVYSKDVKKLDLDDKTPIDIGEELFDTYTDNNGLVYYYGKDTDALKMIVHENYGEIDTVFIDENTVLDSAKAFAYSMFEVPEDVVVTINTEIGLYYKVEFFQNNDKLKINLCTMYYYMNGQFYCGSFDFGSYIPNPGEEALISKSEAISIAAEALRKEIGELAEAYIDKSTDSFSGIYSNSIDGELLWEVYMGNDNLEVNVQKGPYYAYGYHLTINMRTGQCVYIGTTK